MAGRTTLRPPPPAVAAASVNVRALEQQPGRRLPWSRRCFLHSPQLQICHPWFLQLVEELREDAEAFAKTLAFRAG